MNEELVKILLVEDDEEDYILACHFLASFKNLDLKWCREYDEALKVFQAQKFDIVLIDYRLGLRNGLELLKELAKLSPHTPLILLTGLGDSEVDLKAMEAGASDYLVKGSIDASALERAIRYSIKQKRSEAEIQKLNEELELRVEERTKELQREIAERKLVQEQYYKLAYFDSLTGLPNRQMMYARLKQAMEDAKRNKRFVAVMFIDVDGFKNINDTLGHLAGDELLIKVAKNLEACVRDSDIVCRYGGDEFIVVMSNLTHEQDASKVADKILEHISSSIKSGTENVMVTLSIGIALYPAHTQNPNELIQLADEAMYLSKDKGKNQFYLYSKEPVSVR